MYLLKNKYCQALLVILLTLTSVKAQMVPVSDPGLSQKLCTKFPLAMNVSCDSIDTVAAAANYSTAPIKLWLTDENLDNIYSLKYFPGLDTIRIPMNNLSDEGLLPLSVWPNLVWLTLTSNELENAPDISVSSSIIFIYLINNKINSFPVGWNSAHPTIQVIDLNNNNLDHLPPLEIYPEIRRLNVQNNQLTFADLVPIKSNPRWGTSIWEFFPQDSFKLHEDVVKKIGEDISLQIPDDSPTNTYYLYKDGQLLDSNYTGIFDINDLEKSHEGIYYAEVRNSEFTQSNAVLTSYKFNLLISDPVDHNDVHVFSPNGDGVADFFLIEGTGSFEILNKGGQPLQMGKLPYSWYGDDKSGANVEPGLYFVKTEKGYLKVLVTY